MAPRQSEKPKIVVNARVDADALKALDDLAVQERRSRSELIDFAVQEYVERHGGKKKAGK